MEFKLVHNLFFANAFLISKNQLYFLKNRFKFCVTSL